MALRRTLCALFMAANMVTVSAANKAACLENCISKTTNPCTEDSLAAVISCLDTECTKEVPTYRNTTNGSSTDSVFSAGRLTSICGVQAEAASPYKANSTGAGGMASATLNLTRHPAPTEIPVAFLPPVGAAYKSGVVEITVVAALLGIGGLWAAI